MGGSSRTTTSTLESLGPFLGATPEYRRRDQSKHIQSQIVRQPAGVFLGAINSGEGISAISSLNLDEASAVHALPHALAIRWWKKGAKANKPETICHNYHIYYNINNHGSDRS
jgi:hypothetical protein